MRKLLLLLLVVLGAVAAFIAARPSRVHVERSVLIVAPADVVFEQVGELRRWSGWSPWMGPDTKVVPIYGGPATGVGAWCRWSGGGPIAQGRMTITQFVPDARIQLRLDSIEPSAPARTVSLHVFPETDATSVLWTLDGELGFVDKLTLLVRPTAMDRAAGPAFERGLVRLKRLAEAEDDRVHRAR